MFNINRPVHCMNAVPANWRARRHRAEERARAPIRRQTKNPGQYQTFAASALFPAIESSGKQSAVSQTELSEQPDIRNLRGYRRCLLQRLERPYGGARSHSVNRTARLGKSGHAIGRLV